MTTTHASDAPSHSTDNRQKLLRLLMGLNFLVMAAIFLINRPWTTDDSAKYLELAQNLSRGVYATSINGALVPQTVRPPGYAVALALMNGFGQAPNALVMLFHLAFVIWGCILVARLAREYDLDPLWFWILLLAYPFVAIYAAFIMSEALSLWLLCLIAWLLGRREAPNLKHIAIAGVASGALCLVRADMILLPFVLTILLALRLRAPELQRGQWLRAGALYLGLTALMLLPYSLWNQRNFGTWAPVPVAGALGHSLYIASWSGLLTDDDVYDMSGGKYTPRLRESGFLAQTRALNTEIGVDPNTTPNDPTNYVYPTAQRRSTSVLRRAAVARILQYPAPYAEHVLSNVWQLWNTTRYPPRVPAIAQLVLRVVSGAVFLLGISAALTVLFSRQNIGLKTLAAMLLYIPALHIWLHTEARYTAAARPLLLLFAVVALQWLWQKRKRTSRDTAIA